VNRALVTGATGFIGRSLVDALSKLSIDVTGLGTKDGDIADPQTLSRFRDVKFSRVFHLAGAAGVTSGWDAPLSHLRTNVLGTASVLEFCRPTKTPLTYVSAYIYGQPAHLPIDEDCPPNPNNPYAESKWLAELACEFYAKYHDLPVTVVRPFNVFGIGQSHNFLIPSVITQALREGEIEVQDLEPRRDYVYLDDLVSALVSTLHAARQYRVYNIGSGTSRSVSDVIDVIQRAAGTHAPVRSKAHTRNQEIPDTRADISRAARELNWAPRHSFEEGIRAILAVEQKASTMNDRQIPVNKGNYSMDTREREAQFELYRGEGWSDEYGEYRRNWNAFPARGFVSDYPLLVDLELASVCNLRCPMCYTTTPEFAEKVNTKLMDFSLFTKIIDEIGGRVPAIRLSLRGEATLHKRFVDAIRYAKTHGIKEVSTLTHGGKLTLEFFAQIVEAGIDWITVSIDGVGETYDKIRAPLTFSDTLERIKAMKRFKDERNLHRPVIKVQSIWPAIRENPALYYAAFSPYVDLVSFNPLIDYLANDTKIDYIEHFTCPQQYQRLVVGADGLVMKCSNDEENQEVIGDLNKETVHAIWTGPAMAAIREVQRQTNGFMQSGVCRKCYLPRTTENELATIGDRTFIVANYVHRTQVVGK
jgi:radical SAM protein with 4Fe4S-binding SPASM domain